MRKFTKWALLVALAGCARAPTASEVDAGFDHTSNSASAGDGAHGDASAAAGADASASDGSGGDGADGSGGDGGGDGMDGDGGDGASSSDAGAGGGGMQCPSVSCTQPMDAGEIKSDIDGSPKTIQGRGPAFVRVLARDGQSSGNAIGGIKAELASATGANYDLYVYGDDSDACTDLNHPSTNPAGQLDALAPVWATKGPFVTVDRTLTFEVRPTNGDCTSTWTLTLSGNPCPEFTLSVGDFCP